MSAFYKVAKRGQRDDNKLQDSLVKPNGGFASADIQMVGVPPVWSGLCLASPCCCVLFWKRQWMRCESGWRKGGREGVPPCAHRHTNSRHSCFVPCALLMKDSLICLSTRWLYLNCRLGFLASCPLALEFMSCSLEWLYAGSRINCLAYISMAGVLRKCTLFGFFFDGEQSHVII